MRGLTNIIINIENQQQLITTILINTIQMSNQNKDELKDKLN